MGGNPGYERTPDGYFRTQQGRITRLEHRLPGTPERLQSGGQEISDWNNALSDGWFIGPSGTLNAPFGGYDFSGTVTRNGNVREQRLSLQSNLTTNEWVRRYSGTTWSAWRRTDNVMIPTAMGDLTPNPITGELIMATGSKSWTVRNCFIPGHRKYRIDFGFYTGQDNGLWTRLIKASDGLPEQGNVYYYTTLVSNTGGPSATMAGPTSFWSLIGAVGAGAHGWFEIENPMETVTGSQKRYHGRSGNTVSTTPTLSNFEGSTSSQDAVQFDGFYMQLSNQANAGVFANAGWMKVTAI